MIGPGGTLLMATDRGCKVTVIYVTNGAASDADARIEETRKVCGELGWTAVRLGGVAAALDVSLDRAKALGAAVRESNPDIVMIPYVLDDNEDHRKATALWLKSGELSAAEIWAYQVYSVVIPNVIVDISDVRERKSRMIGLYTSQMQRRDWANFALGRDAWSSRWLSGRRTAAWAEGFFVVPAAEYLAHAKIYFDANKNSPTV
jgi:LmbE family N-acetylglucosaminyl deacetylase